jgi:hypothetical protein
MLTFMPGIMAYFCKTFNTNIVYYSVIIIFVRQISLLTGNLQFNNTVFNGIFYQVGQGE